MHFFLNEMIEVIRGDAVLINQLQLSQNFFNFRQFVAAGNINHWLIALKLDYKHLVKIANNKHPEHKQIVKLINISIEYGIKIRWQRLFKHRILMYVYLFEQLADQEILSQLRNQIKKMRNQITFDQLSTVFLSFFISLPISLIVFVLELIFYFSIN